MNMLKKTLLVAGIGAALGFGTTASAGIVDLFDDPALPSGDRVVDETVGGGGCGAGATAGASASGNGCFFQFAGTNIIGGFRDLFVESVSQDLNAGADVRSSLSAGGSFLSFSNNAGTVGLGVVQWDGNDNSADLDLDGLGGANLIIQEGCGPTGCNQFVASVTAADQGFSYAITVVDMFGRISTLQSVSLFAIPPNPPEDAVYLFEWFSRDTGCYFELGLPFCIERSGAGTLTDDINFASVGALQFMVNQGNNVPPLGPTPPTIAVDLSLSSITKTGEKIPEPGTLALAGLALMGMAGLRRRSKS